MSLSRKLKKLIYRDYFSDRPRVYERFGALWLLRYRNYIDRKLILGELFEGAQLAYCSELVRRHRVTGFVDVGANFGLYSVYLATRFPELTTMVAFEPDARNYPQLCANLFLNDQGARIDARRLGISSEKGAVEFLSNVGTSTGMSRIAGTAPKGTKVDKFRTSRIEVDTLDAQLAQLSGQTLYIKIDVEGHEAEVLRGGTGFFAANRCLLQMEILSDQAQAIARLKADYGFSLVEKMDNDFFLANF